MQEVPHVALGACLGGQLVVCTLRTIMYVVGMPLSSPRWLRSLVYMITILSWITLGLFWRRGAAHANTQLWMVMFAVYILLILAAGIAVFSGVRFAMNLLAQLDASAVHHDTAL